MTLGEWIDALEGLPASYDVRFADGGVPQHLVCWRGDARELTLIVGSQTRRSVGALLGDARAAVGTTFEGFKGGEYDMDRSTRIWADDYGQADGITIDDVTVVDGTVLLHLGEPDDA